MGEKRAQIRLRKRRDAQKEEDGPADKVLARRSVAFMAEGYDNGSEKYQAACRVEKVEIQGSNGTNDVEGKG